MEPLYFKRDLKQLHSCSTLTFWYPCFNLLLYYLLASLFLSLFIHSNTLKALLLKFFLSLIFSAITTIHMQRKIKPLFYISPQTVLKLSSTSLHYKNDITNDSKSLEIPFSELIQIDFFTDCLSPTPFSISLKTDSQVLSLDCFENMQQLVNSIMQSAPSSCEINWHNTFFPVLHTFSLIIVTFYLFILSLLITFVNPAFYLLIIIVPLSFGLFYLIQTLFTQHKSVSWHITKLTTSILFVFLGLLPILISLAVNSYK